MAETLIRVDNLSKKFCRDLKTGLWYGLKDLVHEALGTRIEKSKLRAKEFWAIQNITFDVKRGECLGLIGHNGAGKSTLLKMLNGLIKPDTGRIEMHGRVGALIELGAGFNPILTGRENVYVNGAVLGFSKAEIEEKLESIVEFAEIGEFIDTPVQYYSSGMKVRLGFAVAAQLEPDILIIDEVLAVGDASFRAKCFNRMHTLLENTAVIFVSHNMPQVMRISNSLMLLEKGKVLAAGNNMGEVIARYHGTLGINGQVRIQGTGSVTVEKVIVKDAREPNTADIEYGYPFDITVLYRVNEVGLLDLRMLIVITDEEQNNIAQIMEPMKDFEPGRLIKTNVHFGLAQFNAGRYYVSIAILQGGRGEFTNVVYNISTFVVKNSGVGYAPILLKPDYSRTEYN